MRESPQRKTQKLSLEEYRANSKNSPNDPILHDDKKLSIAQSRKILEKNGAKYTDEEIIEVQDFIYTMATIQYLFITEQFLKWTPEKRIATLEDNLTKITDPEQSERTKNYIKKIKKELNQKQNSVVAGAE